MLNAFQLHFKVAITSRYCLGLVTLFTLTGLAGETKAAVITVINPGFEDVSGQSVTNEFTFGTPNGWSLFGSVIGDPGVFTGTLEPNGTDFFNDVAPEGIKVGLLFNNRSEGEGEYGFLQTLADTLQADTTYELSVEVGNITSGTDQNGNDYDLSGFPGYRIELLAGGTVLVEDINSLVIPEAEFATSVISFSVDAGNVLIGQNLGIRLVNLNVIPGGVPQVDSPDLEVDFDDVRLTATANNVVPEPSSLALLGFGALLALVRFALRGKRELVASLSTDS